MTHSLCFENFIDFLNRENIQYIIIRGFLELPVKPDTDLDIVFKEEDYNKVITFLENNDNFNKIKSKPLNISNIKCLYSPFYTNLPKNKDIPNGCFRIDVHNHFFFFYKEKTIIDPILENDIFNNYILYKNRYKIPNFYWEYILLLYRIIFDLSGKFKKKHMDRLNFLEEQLDKTILLNKINTLNRSEKLKKYIINKKLLNTYNSEYHAFIFWKKNAIDYFEKKNTLDIIEKKKVNFSNIDKRYKAINNIYEIDIPKTHPKILLTEPINIVVVKDNNPKNSVRVTSGLKIKKIVNDNLFSLKNEIRKKYSSIYLHASDEINEANRVFKEFNMEKYINKISIVDIENIRGVIWKNKQHTVYELKKIENTPHYKMLNGDLKSYNDYIINFDSVHSLDKFKNLIKIFNPYKVQNNYDFFPKTYITDTGHYLVYDGLHRISLYKYYGYKKIKCIIMDDNNKYNKIKPLSCE
tara:strand:+ start:47 stop:1447 length:1401 start_codon:yes stop_codon:yes gene_type:complete